MSRIFSPYKTRGSATNVLVKVRNRTACIECLGDCPLPSLTCKLVHRTLAVNQHCNFPRLL
uniref:Bm13520 n=1 Tax=Brugia malayi TaxID=6279 RepID=A0A0J9XZE5_BRUMA|nr:Bm13520 [Brugia malayi]